MNRVASALAMSAFVLGSATGVFAQEASKSGTVPVTAENFPRAETDLYFAGLAAKKGAFGKFSHDRVPPSIDAQTVVRLNRDTLYSALVLDLAAGPATITLPDAGKRFMSMQVVNEDEYTPEVVYGAGTYTLTQDKVGTRYAIVAVRTLVDLTNPKDIEEVHALQDAIKLSQPGGPGKLELPHWDPVSQNKVRSALLVLAATLPDTRRSFGTKEQVDPVRFLVQSAAAWGGNPDKDAMYLNIVPPKNDGKTVYKLTAKDVPVDGFWSVSVYNAKGYFQKNAADMYTLNNVVAKKDGDGSVTIQFGGCDGKIPNCIPTMSGWNYLVRLYRPRAAVLDGSYKFPDAQPVGK
nr:DUF1254 domain-containing protein [Dyella sp. ASV24]